MLAVAGAKGGVGRTTCALAAGIALARAGEDPLVVDCNPAMPDLARMAGCRLTDTRHGLDRLGEDPLDSLVTTMPAHPGVTLLPTGLARARTIGNALDRLSWSGPVLLDCPAGTGRASAVPLRAADRSVLVTTPTDRAITATRRTEQMAQALDAPSVGTIVAKSDGGTTTHRRFDCELLAHIPLSNRPIMAFSSQLDWNKISRRAYI